MKKATRQHTKNHNSRLILKTIYDQNMISRADIARTTHLTRATVSTIVADLIDENLVTEAGLGPSIGGKPPRLLTLADDARQLLCLDLSTSCFRGALTNLRGEIDLRMEMMVDGRGGDDALQLVFELVDNLLARAQAPVLGIGIGTPGLVNSERGIIKQAVNLGWQNVPLRELLETRTGCTVHIANDSHVAAMAVYSFDPQPINNLVLIKAGRGIGAGIVLNGSIYFGDDFSAGEIGHISVVAEGPLCRCGNRGCLETVASIQSILQQYAELTGSVNPSWESVLAALDAEDETAVNLVNQAGFYLGTTVAHLIGILNIRQIVIAGSIMQAGDAFLTGVQTAVAERVMSTMAEAADIRYTTLDNIVLLGAAALILKHRLGVL